MVANPDLDVARRMAEAGISIFVAEPDPAGVGHSNTGFWLPKGWALARPNPAVVDNWATGMALCAVGGWGFDFIDIDPRNGGDASYAQLNGGAPQSYGWVATPSGGFHSYIHSLGTGSRDGIYEGVDLKGGRPDGQGRGFVFLPPTVRASKVDKVERPYTWVQPLDLSAWAQLRGKDQSVVFLADYVRGLLSVSSKRPKTDGSAQWLKLMAPDPMASEVVTKVIERLIVEVEQWASGDGDNFRSWLRDRAYTIGGWVGAEGQAPPRDEMFQRLIDAADKVWGVADDRDRLWIEQGLDDGSVIPFGTIYTKEDEAVAAQTVFQPYEEPVEPPLGGGNVPPAEEPPWTDYTNVRDHPFDPEASSDQELAEAAAVRLAPLLRYGMDAGVWLRREPYHWVERTDQADWGIATLARLMPLGESPVPKDLSLRTEGHWKAVRRAKFLDSGGSSKIKAKLQAVMKSMHYGGLKVADLDTNPEILWAGGIPYDLRASQDDVVVAALDLDVPHLHSAQYRPEAIETPLWDAFLRVVWPDEEERAWALRVLSIAYTGYADAALPVLWGEERNGKTSVVEFLMDTLGTYGVSADAKLLAGVDNAHGSIVYALKGSRLAFVDEGPRRGHLATERLKQLTGGGRLTGNAMRANPVTFKTTHTLVMTSNEPPPLTDPALRARIRAIHCAGHKGAVRVARAALTPEAWRREAPGVLRKMILEASAWLADRDSAQNESAPASYRQVVEEEVASQNPVREWVNIYTVPADPGTPGRQLYEGFCSWFRRQERFARATAPSETMFGRTLTDMGYPATKIGRGNERLNFRPLSVFGEPSTTVPTPPGAGAGWGGVGGSSDSHPAPTESSRSDLPFSSFGVGGESSHSTVNPTKQTYTQIEQQGKKVQPNTEVGPNPLRTGVENGDPPGGDRSRDRVEANRPPPRPRDQSVTYPPVTKDDLTPPPESSQPVVSGGLTKEAAEVARLADEKKISKLEARKQLKEELIREAVTEAQGELLDLPVAVDREGLLTVVTLPFARQLLAVGTTLTVDVETTGYPIGHVHYRLKTVQLGNEAVAVVLDPDDDAQRLLISEALNGASKLHAHSASADLVPLAVAGLLDYDAGWAKMHDTVIPAKLGDPQSTGSDPGLKKLSAAVLGDQAVAPAADEGREALFKAGKWLTNVKPHHPVEKSGWANVNPRSAVMLRYAASDVLDTAALAKRLPPVRSDIEARERVAEEMTARIAYRGFKIDHERVRTLTAEHSALQAQFGAQVREFGIENPGSAQQVAVRLAQMGAVLPLTPGGSPSVAEHVLSVLRRSEGEKGVLAGAVLDYRHSSTVLGLFLAPYAQLCDLGDSRARPTIYTMGADTGRMTSTRPNAQQLPRAGGIRSIYTADPGMVFISADFSGVELRGAAALSQDPDMIRMITEEDAGRFDGFHWQIARQAYGPDATKADRYNAKRGVFGCVPLDTEILTQRGWLTHDQVKVGDKTPGRASDGTIRWTPVTGVHVYEDAPLMKIHGGQTWNATTTPGHRWAATRRRDGGAQGRYFVDEWTTTETISPEHTVHLGGLLDAPGTLDVSPDEAALIGWAITDGSVGFAPITGRTAQGTDGRRRKAMVKLYQSKPEGVTTIRKLLGALGLAAGERELPVAHKRTMLGYVWLLPAAPMRELFGRAKLLTDAGFDRGQLEAFVLGLSTTARWAFLEAVIAAEGHGSTISQNEGPSCDAIELAAYLCGYYVTRSVNDRRGNAVNYKLRLCTPKVTGQKLRREDAGHAPVWCVSTGLGTWTMRHSGQIMLTGNTFYGGGAAGLSKQIGVTEQEMFVIIDSLKSIAPGYFRWADGVRAAVRNGSTQFPSCSGRIIHLDQSTPHKAPAYCIQGSCRELLIDALLRWRDTRWGNTTVLPIHDELIAMVPADEAHDATLELVRCMESSLYGVAIKADPGKFDDEANQRFTGSSFWRDAE